MKSKISVHRLAQYGILTALALVLSYLESLIPAFFFIPGMKLGLTNLVIVIALYRIDSKSAIIINLIRILLVSFLFGNMTSLLYSLAGGILSCLVMILIKKTDKFKIVTTSIAGGIMHNVGQILVAVIILETKEIWWYMCILWFFGIITGAAIGLLAGLVCKKLPPKLFDS